MSILIKNGRIVTANDDFVGDIFINGETISAIGKNLSVDVDEQIDATGMLVFPGGIDPHVPGQCAAVPYPGLRFHEMGLRRAVSGI